MSAKEVANIHAGHRERVLDIVDRVGLVGLSPIQAIEFMLFYIFPRGDTNPLAHRLIDKFKTFDVILDASIEDLASVEGMGITSAKKMKALVELFNLYVSSKTVKKVKLQNQGEVYDYIEAKLRFKVVEELIILGFNANGKLVGERCLARGTINMVGIDMKNVANFVNTYNVPYVFLAHNHPGGRAYPSAQDDISFEKLAGQFSFSGCLLKDSVIIGEDGIFSMASNALKRLFLNSDEYQKMIKKIKQVNE